MSGTVTQVLRPEGWSSRAVFAAHECIGVRTLGRRRYGGSEFGGHRVPRYGTRGTCAAAIGELVWFVLKATRKGASAARATAKIARLVAAAMPGRGRSQAPDSGRPSDSSRSASGGSNGGVGGHWIQILGLLVLARFRLVDDLLGVGDEAPAGDLDRVKALSNVGPEGCSDPSSRRPRSPERPASAALRAAQGVAPSDARSSGTAGEPPPGTPGPAP